jgi:hypothetical protein
MDFDKFKMDVLKFIKHPLKEGDTVESVAQHFGITPDRLQLIHNINVNDNYYKIFNIRGAFPYGLKEIFITEETYQSYIDRENEKRPKNDPNLKYKPLKDKTIYEVVYTILDGEQNQISFETSIEGLKSNPKIYGHLVQIERTSITLLNNEYPELAVDELALVTAKVIYPLQIIINYRGKFVGIINYEEIVKRWEIAKETIRDNFESEQAERYILYTEKMLQTEATLVASLQKDWFLKAFFSEIYDDYYYQYKVEKKLEFPFHSELEKHTFSIIQEMNPYADDESQLTICQTGTLATDDTNSIKGTFESKYLLDPIDKTIKNITLESSLDLKTPKKLAITITKK